MPLDCGSDRMVRGSSFSKETTTGVEGTLPGSVNEANRICVCTASRQKEKCVVDCLLNTIINFIHDQNCPNFELCLKMKREVVNIFEKPSKLVESPCKLCHGSSTGHVPSFSETETYSSQELEVNLSHPTRSTLQRNKSSEVADADRRADWKANESFLVSDKMPSIFKGSFVRVKTKVGENGTKIAFKFHLVRKSKPRRCYSLSDIDVLRPTHVKKFAEKSNSFRNVAHPATRHKKSLSGAWSSITIGEMSMDVGDLTNAGANAGHHAVSAPLDAPCSSTLKPSEELAEVSENGVSYFGEFDLEERLKRSAVFAEGQFGPLYKGR